jgi:hypothetical protein
MKSQSAVCPSVLARWSARLSRNQAAGRPSVNRRDIARRGRNQTGRQPDSTQRPQRVSKRVAEETCSLLTSAPTSACSALKKSSPNATKLVDSTAEERRVWPANSRSPFGESHRSRSVPPRTPLHCNSPIGSQAPKKFAGRHGGRKIEDRKMGSSLLFCPQFVCLLFLLRCGSAALCLCG